MAKLPAGIPVLPTARLRLRPYTPADALAVTLLADDPEVSRYLIHVPYPYPVGLATTWIAGHVDSWVERAGVTWAVCRLTDGVLVGTASLRWVRRHDHAELGYWLGRRYWGHGYAFEAATAALDWGFDVLRCARIFAQHLGGNLRSARILDKLGMTAEGVRRAHIKKAGEYHDAVQFGILRAEHTAHRCLQ